MKIARGILAAYVAPALALAAVGLPVVVYLPPYYAGSLGLDLSVVGLIFFLVRIVDVPLDPIVGHLVDRTTSRFGRFRPWLAGGAVVMAMGVWLVFMATPGISAPMAFLGLLVMYMGYSSAAVSHTAWGAVLSDDYHERSRVFGWWQAANLAGLFLILAVPPLAQGLAGKSDPAIGVHAMGWVLLIALPLMAFIAVSRVPERPRLGGQHHRLREILGVFKLPLLRRLLLADLFASLAPGVTGALFLFFFEANRGYKASEASTLLLFYFASGLLAAPLWIVLARRWSKHGAVIVAFLANCVSQATFVLLPKDNFPVIAMAMLLAGVPAVAPAFLLRAMLADVSDAETLRSGQERTGLFFAALVATQKLGYAIPVGLSYAILGAIGFAPKLGAANTASALLGLTLLFIVPPILFALVAVYILRGWPIDADVQAANAAALAKA